MNNEIATANNNNAITFNNIGAQASGLVSSIDMSTRAGKLQTFAATQDAQQLEDHLNEPIKLVHVVMQAVQLTDPDTHETRQGVRTILIDADGVAYATSSDAVRNAIVNLMSIMGTPTTWEEPLTVRVERGKSRSGRYFYKLVPSL